MDGFFPGQGAAIVSRYPGGAFESLTSAAAEALGDGLFVCPTRKVARAFAKRGANAFVYRFAHVPTSGTVQGKGVYHGAEVPFVFGNPSLGVVLDASEQRLSKAMQGYWVALASTGSPGTEDMVSWPIYDLASEADLVLDLQLSTETSLKKAACDFWDTITP
jgi:para-nitrobenzyl esterase